MPRKPLQITNEHPYHVRGRSNNREWFELGLDECCTIFAEVLEKTIDQYGFEVHLFVLMNNHFHMLVTTPKLNLSAGMRYFMTEASRRLRKGSNKINHVFGGRYKGTVVSTEYYYLRCYKYLYRNPIRAGICQNVLEHPFSSLTDRRMSRLIVGPSTGHDSLLPTDRSKILAWLDEPTPVELDLAIKSGLRRSDFKISAPQKNRSSFSAEMDRPR